MKNNVSNETNHSPAVQQLARAIETHDSAAMVLGGRDNDVAWAGRHPILGDVSVTVGQLREVLALASHNERYVK